MNEVPKNEMSSAREVVKDINAIVNLSCGSLTSFHLLGNAPSGSWPHLNKVSSSIDFFASPCIGYMKGYPHYVTKEHIACLAALELRWYQAAFGTSLPFSMISA